MPTEDRRPDPDALLAHLEALEPERHRGRLTVFFGAVPGVGKTYAMLEAARERQREGLDVLVGVVETHGRSETEALLAGLEVLPRRTIGHGGVTLEEFDLDAALERRPPILLLDELAHTNAPGSRHAKRWQDAEELLGAGIDVYTTLNVQHVESLNDVVARITHVKVRETVPDALLERADEIALVDISPEVLLKRLREGKVYVPEQARRAADHFFRRGNVIALRQIALRQTAERVDADLRVYRRAFGVGRTWPVRERIVVGVGPAPSSQRLVRATKRLADGLGAEWSAVFVETPEYAGWSEPDRDRVWETLRLAEKLGGTAVTVGGRGVDELLEYARRDNATKIVVGKPTHAAWRDRLLGSKLEDVVRGSGDVDVYVITAPGEETGTAPRRANRDSGRAAPRAYAAAAAAIALCTALAFPLRPHVAPSIVLMLYLVTVVFVASRLGRGPSVVAAVGAVATFDVVFVPPFYTFAVADTQYFIVFAVMLLVALVITTLTDRLRGQAAVSRRRERRTAALLQLSAELVRTSDPRESLRVGARHVASTFDADVVILAPNALGELRSVATGDPGGGPHPAAGASLEPSARATRALRTREDAVVRWVFDHGQAAGRGTETLPEAEHLYVPLSASGQRLGVLGIRAGRGVRDPEHMHVLEAFAEQIATAVDRARLVEETRRAAELLETSRARAEVFYTAAEELRAPLERLERELDRARPAASAEPLGGGGSAAGAAGEIRAVVDRLASAARAGAGHVSPTARPISPAALIRHARRHCTAASEPAGPAVDVEIEPGLPQVLCDAERASGLLSTLLRRALRRAGRTGRVVVAADRVGPWVQFTIADDGPPVTAEGLAASTETAGTSPLDLAEARSAARGLGGEFWIDPGPGAGLTAAFTLPVASE